jgi:hypothetical protein
VAFLTEDGEHADLVLDGIFADCYQRWGGRFSLIVPCTEGRIAPGYWNWLEAYDPDIVYSYIALSEADVLEVHERLSPTTYSFHEQGSRLDVYGFKPSYGFSPLSSLSTIFRLARHSPLTGEVPRIRIIDSWQTEQPSRFLTDNFGTYRQSWATSLYPSDATPAATLLEIVSDSKRSGPMGVRPEMDTVSTEMAAFEEFAKKRATSLSLISALFAPKLDISAGRWSGSFNLVVGDTFEDRILFWNARLLVPAWLDSELCCFRVSMDQLNNSNFLRLLGDLLKQRNHVNPGAGGQAHLSIRSASADASQLSEAREKVLSCRPWGPVVAESITTLDQIAPPLEALQTARESIRLAGDFYSRSEWLPFVWSPPIARPPAIIPDHILDAPARQRFVTGFWCTDFLFQCDETTPAFATDSSWILPKRWRMAGAFAASLVGAPRFDRPPEARRSRGGNLTVSVSADHPVETIRVPTAYEAVRYALVDDGAWVQPDAPHRIYPASKAAWMELSNEARYLAGVLGMMGGLERAGEVLLHPFIQQMFSKLGGTPRLAAESAVPTVRRLQKRARREAIFDLRQENETQTLADLIVRAARSLKAPMDFVSYDDLRESWRAYRSEYWAANPLRHAPDPSVDWARLEEDSLERCLRELRYRKMMLQGYQWTCRNCHHRNWVDLSALAPELLCEVCTESSDAPIDIRWLFRPNEFLIESLRDHSVLSLIWTLSALRRRSRRSFLFVGPTCFGFTRGSRDRDAEADLLALIDGEALLCEVKSSWHSMRPSQIADFVAVAKRLRPDGAVLAVMETGMGPTADLMAARAELNGVGISYELLTLDVYQPRDDPYLH